MKTDLDTSKTFATVYGTNHPWKYEQDGRYFGRDMMEVHEDGTPVTVAEKIAKKQKEKDILEAKRRALVEKELIELHTQVESLDAEKTLIYINDAATKVHLIGRPFSEINTVREIKDALDLLEYPYDETMKKDDLAEILRNIFDAAK